MQKHPVTTAQAITKMLSFNKKTVVILAGISAMLTGKNVYSEIAVINAGANTLLPNTAAKEVVFSEDFIVGADTAGSTRDLKLPGNAAIQLVFTETSAASRTIDTPVVKDPPEDFNKAAGEVVFSETTVTTEAANSSVVKEKAADTGSGDSGFSLVDIPASSLSVDTVTVTGATVVAQNAESDQQVIRPRSNAEPSGRFVVLSNVEFEGNEVITDGLLSEIAQPFVGRQIGLSELEELRVQLTEAYVDRGYVNSGALLPDQKVEDGNIVYQIIEGSIEEVNITGDGDLVDRYVSERILKDATNPFNSFALQENFQLLLDDPLIERLDGQLQSLPESGKSALNLKVLRGKPYDVSIAGNNHGALSLGSQQILLSALRRNLTGVGDEIGATLGGNQSKFNLSAYYEIPLSSKETRLTAEVTLSDSSVMEEPFDTVDIESQTSGINIFYSRDLTRKVDRTSTVGSGLSLRESSNRLAGEPFSFSRGEVDGRSRVAVARLWHDLLRRRETDVFALRSTLNIGLDMFGSTIHSEDLPSSEFLTLQGQMQYSRRVLNNAQLLFRADAQISNSELLSLERFALGGAVSVRGYRENELVRDTAVFSSAELRYPFYNSAQFGSLQFAPFIDIGYGANDGQFSAEENLSSIGFGLLWNLRNRLAADLYFGVPLNDLETSDGNSLQERGIHLNVSAKL